MSQRDGFAGGFLAGAFVGGLVGGMIGALLATHRTDEADALEESVLADNFSEAVPEKDRKRHLKGSSGQRIEVARHSLEDKIAQLNQTIDEVRQQIGNVDRNAREERREQIR